MKHNYFLKLFIFFLALISTWEIEAVTLNFTFNNEDVTSNYFTKSEKLAYVSTSELSLNNNSSNETIKPIPGFTSLGKLRNNAYYLSNNNFTGAAAYSNAIEQGGFVASIGNEIENQFLKDELNNVGGLANPVLLGLNDLAQENTFEWQNGKNITYTNWNSGEPNNSGGNEDYVVMNSDGKWNDIFMEVEVRYILVVSELSIDCNEEIRVSNDLGTCGSNVTVPPPYIIDYCRPISGFFELGSFNNKTYYLSEASFTGSAAFNDAISKGGFVATISGFEENQFIYNAVRGKRVWIGLNDVVTEGEYKWQSGVPLSYTNFSTNEPNNAGGNEDYVEMNSVGTWNDLHESTPLNYILEFESKLTNDYNNTSDASDFYPVGTTNVIWTITDCDGNTESCTQVVTVEDREAPTAIAQSITVQLDQNGQATIAPSQINNGSSDNCNAAGDLVLSLDKTSFECKNVGARPSNDYALNFDGNDNVSILSSPELQLQGDMTMEAWFRVDRYNADWVRIVGKGNDFQRNYGLWYHPDGALLFQQYGDGINVQITKTLNLGEWYHIAAVKSGSVGKLYVNGILVGSNTGGTNPSISNDPLTIGYAGFHTYHIGGIDEVRLWNMARTDQEIQDNYKNTIPTNSQGLLAYYTMEDGSGVTLSDQTGNSFEGTLLGFTQPEVWTASTEKLTNPNEITLTVTDATGNFSTATATVTVEDKMNPILSFEYLDQSANVPHGSKAGGLDGMGQSFTAGISGLLSKVRVNFGQDTGRSVDVFIREGEGGYGEIVSSTEFVASPNTNPDWESISFSTPVNVIAGNVYTIWMMESTLGARGDVKIASHSGGYEGGRTYFHPNIGSSSSMMFETFVTQNSIEINNDPGVDGAVVTFHSPQASDNCAEVSIAQTAGLASGSTFPVGTTTNTFQATDGSGNTSSRSFDVTVVDIEAPKDYTVSIVQSEIDETNETSTSFSFADAEVESTYNYTFSSNNGGTNVTGSGTIATATDQITGIDLSGLEDGIITLSVTLTDVALNQGSSTTDTVIKDTNLPPLAVCQNFTAQLDTSGNITISPSDLDGGSSDDRPGYTLSLDKSTFDCSNIGTPVNVTLTITDSNGVTDTCTATVTVEDNEAPTAIARDITVELDENGMASITLEDVLVPASEEYIVDQTGDFNPIDISGTETNVLLEDDEVSAALPIGFSFDFYGNSYSNFYISSNGFITFNNDNEDGCCEGEFLPTTYSPNNIIAMAWGDLNPEGGGIIRYLTTGTVPNRVLIVEFNGVPQFESENPIVTQVQLYEGTNVIEIHTTTMPSEDYAYTQGVENSDGTEATTTPGRNSSEWSANNDYVSFTYSRTNSVDNCEVESTSIDVSTFDCSNIGENTVIITVKDVNGNEAKFTSIVTVEDNLAPVIIQPEDLVLNTNNDECSHTFLEPLTLEASDNCEIESIVGTRSDGLGLSEPFPLGETTISWIVTDANSNSFPSSETFEEGVLSSPAKFTSNATLIDFENSNSGDIIKNQYSYLGVQFFLNDGSVDGAGSEIIPSGPTENNVLVNTNEDEFPDSYNLEMTFPNGINRVGFETMSPFSGFELSVKYVRDGEVIHNENYMANETSQFIGFENSELFDQVIIEIPSSFDGGDVPFPGDGPMPGGDFPRNIYIFSVDNLRFERAKEVEPVVQKITVVDKQPANVVTKDFTVQLDETGNTSITAEDVDNGSSDACGIASMSVSPESFTCAEVGENTVTLTVIDNNGNESTTTSKVTVEDNVAPVASAQDIIVQLDENGTATITAEDVDSDSSDACGIASMSVSPDSFTCAEVGENTVTLTVIDNNGNESTATSKVTVEDNVAPVAISKDITVQLDETGNVTIIAADVDNESSDACGIASMRVSPDSFTCAEVGENTVTLTVIDNNGNESTATSKVTVEDSVAPVASAQAITIQLDENGVATITAEDVDNGSSDACGIASMSVSPDSFTCAEVGENTVTLTVIDNNGNESTTTSKVTIEDNVAPVASAQDISVQLDENGTATITAAEVDNGSSDACGIALISVSPDSFTCAEVGENTITLTVIDTNGNESTTTSKVTVEDNVAPVASAQDIIVQLDENGTATITAEDIDNSSLDACGIASMSVSPDSFTCAEIGDNTVTLTVTDVNGNESTTTSIVTVEDSIKPIPSATTLPEITAECEVVETGVTAPTATDNCGGVVSVSNDANFPITAQGLTVITWSFEDANGNIATQTQDVMIEDMTAPIPDVDSLEDIIVECEATTIEAPTATDNCAGTVTGTTLDPTSYSEEGEYMILWEFNDGNGNVSSQEQWVTVKDNTAPEVTTQDLIITVTQDEPAVITPEEVNDGSTDNCGELILSLDRDTFDKPGVYEVVLTATDASGNTSQATAKITVKREGADPKEAHVVPTMLTRTSMAKVILPFNGRISEVHVMETETNNYKVFEGNKKNTMQIDMAPMKGTLLVKIIDAEGNVYMKKLIAL